MQGLELHALQTFLQSRYGQVQWQIIQRNARLLGKGHQAEGEADAKALIQSAALHLREEPDSLLEDFGIWLIASPMGEPLRRLLRFGGETFIDFLYSLEELSARVGLALPELQLPHFEVRQLDPDRWFLCSHDLPPHLHVTIGVLRAMADDYGALVVLTPHHTHAGLGLQIRLITASHAQARDFSLAHGL